MTADKFFNADAVLFNDASTNGNVTIAATVQPGSITISNIARAYTFSGSAIAGATALQKTGAGSLTLSASNSFTGGTLINGGNVFLANDTANQFGLGLDPVTLAGGTLNMFSSAATTNPSAWNLIVPSATTGRLNTDAACDLYGSLTGGGTFNLFVPSTNTTFYGDWSAFTGQINVLTGAGGDFRMANLNGLPGAAVNLSSNAAAYVAVDPGTDTTLDIGALSGSASARWLGSPGDSIFTWRIGAANSDATFAGNIAEQTATSTTAIVKTGSGTWTLSGSNSYAGDTTVSAGTLRVNNQNGSGTGLGNLTVVPGATLGGNGFIGSDAVLNNGARLAPDNRPGTLTFSSNLTLNDTTALRFELGTNCDRVAVNGNLFLTGQLSVTNAAGFGAGTYTLFTYGTLALGNLVIASAPAGYNYTISTNTPGAVKLVVSPTAPPVFGNVSISGGNLSLAGSNGIPFGNYWVQQSSNLVNWTSIATNQFDVNGGFSFTTNAPASSAQNFFRLQLP